MAFVGRMYKRGKFIESEVNSGGRSEVQMQTCSTADEEGQEIPHERCSRTYIKTYGLERTDLVSIPSTVRFVGGSASSCEVDSMADTEMSTLRYSSPRSLETVTETLMLCQSPVESSSENSSMSASSRYSDPTEDDPQQQEEMISEQTDVEERQLERGSTTSMCSWEPEEAESIYEEETPQTELESQGVGVPYLELGSDTISLYGDQQEQLGHLKELGQSSEAYDNWLSGKNRQHQYKQQAAREKKRIQQEKEEERRKLNEQRVQEWCKRKELQSIAVKQSRINDRTQTQVNLDQHLHLQAWEMRKIQEAEQRRQLQENLEYRKLEQQQQRREQADLAWNRWIKSAAHRPKPVPLNQGFNTLRGTISDIYINPNQWVR